MLRFSSIIRTRSTSCKGNGGTYRSLHVENLEHLQLLSVTPPKIVNISELHAEDQAGNLALKRGDHFGTGVSAADNIAAIGASPDDEYGRDACAVYIFEHDTLVTGPYVYKYSASSDSNQTCVSTGGTGYWCGDAKLIRQDGDQSFSIVLAPATSLDADDNGLDAHDVSVTNVDDEAPVLTTVFVGDLDASSTSGRGSKWNAIVAIVVRDAAGNHIADGTVSGSWSDGATGSPSCTTDSSGVCTVRKNSIKSNVNAVTLTVSTIGGAGLSYDEDLNTDPDGDSDGTSIVVS